MMKTFTCTHEKGASFGLVPCAERSFNCPFSSPFFFLQGCHSFKRLYIVCWPLSVHQSPSPTDRLSFPRYSNHSGRLWCLSRAISLIGRSCYGQSRVPTRPPLPEQCF